MESTALGFSFGLCLYAPSCMLVLVVVIVVVVVIELYDAHRYLHILQPPFCSLANTTATVFFSQPKKLQSALLRRLQYSMESIQMYASSRPELLLHQYECAGYPAMFLPWSDNSERGVII